MLIECVLLLLALAVIYFVAIAAYHTSAGEHFADIARKTAYGPRQSLFDEIEARDTRKFAGLSGTPAYLF